MGGLATVVHAHLTLLLVVDLDRVIAHIRVTPLQFMGYKVSKLILKCCLGKLYSVAAFHAPPLH